MSLGKFGKQTPINHQILLETFLNSSSKKGEDKEFSKRRHFKTR